MFINKEQYLLCGEFAKSVGTTKHTLFHYDKLDLLKPEIVLENGYRYYSVSQINVFLVIELLKELDMPLKDIKSYMDKRDPHTFIQLLNEEEEIIEDKIKKLKKLKKRVSEQKIFLKSILEEDLREIQIKYFPKQYLFLKNIKSYDNKAMAKDICNLVQSARIYDIVSPYGIGACLHNEEIKQKGYGCYKSIYYLLDTKPKQGQTLIKPEGKYLCAYHVGSFTTIYKCYDRIIEYAKLHNLKLDDIVYEDMMIDEIAVQNPEDYVLRLSMRIIE